MKDTLHKQMEAADIQQGHVAAQKMANADSTKRKYYYGFKQFESYCKQNITVQSLRIQFMSLCI